MTASTKEMSSVGFGITLSFSPSIWLLLSQWSINRLSTIQMQTIDYSDKAEEPFSDVASLSFLFSLTVFLFLSE